MDRDKVINELVEHIESALSVDSDYVDCVRTDLLQYTVALLKEKEAVEPRRDANCVRMFRCGVCGEYVGFIDSDPGDPNEQDNYCRNCGTPVLWKGR